jgi:hypothetical protein
MYSLMYLLKYNYGVNRTMWSICVVNQQIVPYWRIYVNPNKKNTWSRRKWILTWFNTCGLLITKKELIKCYFKVMDIYGSNLIIRRRFLRMGLWKIWSDVWDMLLVEEGLTRTWSWRTKHQRRVSESLDIEVPDVMEKGKWMFNPRSQSSYEESHISKCQSLLN